MGGERTTVFKVSHQPRAGQLFPWGLCPGCRCRGQPGRRRSQRILRRERAGRLAKETVYCIEITGKESGVVEIRNERERGEGIRRTVTTRKRASV